MAALLRDRPYDAEAALMLAERYATRDADRAQARALARRAVEFGGGPKAKKMLQKLRPQGKAQELGDAMSTAQPAEAARAD